MTARQIAIDKLTAEELAALDLAGQAIALNEILAEGAICGRELRKARLGHAEAKKAVLLASVESKDHAKAAAIDAQLLVQFLLDRARVLRESKSILQTLLRMGSP